MKEPKDMQSILEEMNGKIDMMMEHMGCKQKEYKNMRDEEKDKMDEEDVMGKDE